MRRESLFGREEVFDLASQSIQDVFALNEVVVLPRRPGFAYHEKRLRRLWPLIWHSHMLLRCCFLRATWNQTFMSGPVPASAMSQPGVCLFRRIYAVCSKRSHYRIAQSLRKSALRQATLKGRRSVKGPIPIILTKAAGIGGAVFRGHLLPDFSHAFTARGNQVINSQGAKQRTGRQGFINMLGVSGGAARLPEPFSACYSY